MSKRQAVEAPFKPPAKKEVCTAKNTEDIDTQNDMARVISRLDAIQASIDNLLDMLLEGLQNESSDTEEL